MCELIKRGSGIHCLLFTVLELTICEICKGDHDWDVTIMFYVLPVTGHEGPEGE
jgi:hypothetical protein